MQLTYYYIGFAALEIFWIFLGWLFIFIRPGIAALRCLRSLHVCWNAAQFGFKGRGQGHYYTSNSFGTIGSKYLSALGAEFFSRKSKGGVAVLVIFFPLRFAARQRYR